MKINELNTKPKFRCAIYTRKSNDEGLDQAFNSLDAQRLAGESYIASQAHEGWECLPTQYNDGGYSGGNMKRPALQRLFQDIRDGKVDCIVVYKIDRLTRSLLDFAKIIELLDEYKCSFVAVTQSFNTSNSMGRLMLNVLLSFAQYERELTSERIRDKFAASSKLGIWMGGVPPLGYDPKNRELIINDKEADLVKLIYLTFLESESITATARKMNQLGKKSKTWVSTTGKQYKGRAFNKSLIRYILKNPIYAGKIASKGNLYQGKHKPIIEQENWDKVQDMLTSTKINTITNPLERLTSPALLKGIIFCGYCGAKMTPTYCSKSNGIRYRYYSCSSKTRGIDDSCEIKNISAAQVEEIVTNKILQILKSPEIVAYTISGASCVNHNNNSNNNNDKNNNSDIYGDINSDSLSDIINNDNDKAIISELSDIQIIEALKDTSKIWDELFPAEQARITRLLIKKVILKSTGLEILIFNEGLNLLTSELIDENNYYNNQIINIAKSNNKKNEKEAA